MLKIVAEMISQLISATIGSKDSSKKAPLNIESPKEPEPLLKEEDGYYVWNKGQNLSLSKYFSTSEFSCRCNFPECKKQRISKTLISRLDQVRVDLKQPLIVTSAYRCTRYQAFLRSAGVNTVVAKVSTHEQGHAADVVPKDGKLDGFEAIASKYFDSIGIAKNFLHLDLRVGRRRWDY